MCFTKNTVALAAVILGLSWLGSLPAQARSTPAHEALRSFAPKAPSAPPGAATQLDPQLGAQIKSGAISKTDQSEATCSDFKVGEYKPFSFWSALKIGTAYYVNPALAKRTSISYIYLPAIAKNFIEAKQIIEHIDGETGKITLARVKSNGRVELIPPNKAKEILETTGGDPEKIYTFLSGEKLTIASKTDDLFGAKPDNVVISYDPVIWSDCDHYLRGDHR